EDEQMNMDRMDLTQLYDLSSVTIKKYISPDGLESGVKFKIDMDDQALERFILYNPDLKVLNMSFQYGEISFSLPLQKMTKFTVMQSFVTDTETGNELIKKYLLPEGIIET